jgi:hypothetical protein
MNQVQISFDRSSGKYVCSINETSFKTTKKDYIEYMFRKITGEKKSYDEIVGAPKAEKKSDKFSINQRFAFVEKLVKMVAAGIQPSAVVTGQGGLGKTFTVTKTLESCGYSDISCLAEFQVGQILNMSKCFRMVKGYSTPKGLYRTLYENNGSVIIFDDCDSVLKDPVALNLLKGALDSYDKRIISWNADTRDEDLPRSFQFEGKVIFISNLTKDSIDQAIRSRSMMIDLTMTTDQKIERMEYIANDDLFMPEYTTEQKTDAIALIKKLKEDAREISLRTLISVTKIRAANDDWEDLATYTLCA